MKPLRILYLKEHVQRGVGDSHSMLWQMKSLSKLGHTQIVLTGWTDMSDEISEAGAKLYEYPPLDNDVKGFRNLWKGARRIAQIARREKADVMHSHHRWTGVLGWFASKMTRIPLVHTDHLPLYGNKLLSYRGDGAIGVSEEGARHLVSYFGRPSDKVWSVPEFHDPPPEPDPSSVKRLRDEIGAGDEDLCIGRLASIIPNKAPEVMLRAFALILEKHPNVHLVMSGTGHLLDEMKGMAESLGVADNTHWLGLRSDISTVLGALDVCTMSSNTEGMPLAIMEAMTLGVPIVSTSVGGVPTLLGENEYGLVVPPQNPEALARETIRLLDDPDLRREYGEAARTRVKTFCAPDVLAGRIEEIFQTVIARRGVSAASA